MKSGKMIENKQPAITWKIYELVIGHILQGRTYILSMCNSILTKSHGYMANKNAGQVHRKMKKEEGKNGETTSNMG